MEIINNISDACKILVAKAKGKKSFEKLRRRWKDNIKMNLK